MGAVPNHPNIRPKGLPTSSLSREGLNNTILLTKSTNDYLGAFLNTNNHLLTIISK